MKHVKSFMKQHSDLVHMIAQADVHYAVLTMIYEKFNSPTVRNLKCVKNCGVHNYQTDISTLTWNSAMHYWIYISEVSIFHILVYLNL